MLIAALALLAQDVPEPLASEPPPRPMETMIVRDAITDEIRAFAILRDRGNRLVVSCEPAKYEGARISVHSRRWLARGNVITGERPVVYRFDNLAPARMMWDVNDRRGLLAGERRVQRFLGEMAASEQLVVRTRDVENHEFDMTFRLLDVGPAVEAALTACAEAGPGQRPRRRWWAPFG